MGTQDPVLEHLAAFQALAQVLMGGEVGFQVVDKGKDDGRKASICCSENGQAEVCEALVEVVQE